MNSISLPYYVYLPRGGRTPLPLYRGHILRNPLNWLCPSQEAEVARVPHSLQMLGVYLHSYGVCFATYAHDAVMGYPTNLFFLFLSTWQLKAYLFLDLIKVGNDCQNFGLKCNTVKQTLLSPHLLFYVQITSGKHIFQTKVLRIILLLAWMKAVENRFKLPKKAPLAKEPFT